VAMGAGLRPTTKGVEPPPDPTVRAPVLHPTGGNVSWSLGGKHGRSIEAGRCVNVTTKRRQGSVCMR
jgi:hypothetical protein